MSFSSIREMLQASQTARQPLYEVILESDLAESGLTRAESEAEMHRLWSVMRATSDGYCGADRSMSGFVGGDAAKVEQAAAQGTLYASGYFASVMAEALKTAECNACMKRIVAAPTAGSCGVLPAVLLPLWRTGAADEEAICRALYVAAGFGQVVAHGNEAYGACGLRGGCGSARRCFVFGGAAAYGACQPHNDQRECDYRNGKGCEAARGGGPSGGSSGGGPASGGCCDGALRTA